MKKSLRTIWAATILGTASVGVAGAATADDGLYVENKQSNLSFTFSIASRHIQQRQFNSFENNSIKRDFNEFNLGLVVNYTLNKLSNSNISTYTSIGAYKNSFYETTYLASATIETNESSFLGKKIDFGLDFGITHGYRDGWGKKFPVLPMGQVFVSAEIAKELDLKLGIIPMTLVKQSLPDNMGAVDVITASIVWRPKR